MISLNIKNNSKILTQKKSPSFDRNEWMSFKYLFSHKYTGIIWESKICKG